MKGFCIILSFTLVLAKIFGLITLGWITCLLPVAIYIAIKAFAIIIVGCVLATNNYVLKIETKEIPSEYIEIKQNEGKEEE